MSGEQPSEDVLELNLRLMEQIKARTKVYPADEMLELCITLSIAVDLILDTSEREQDETMRLDIASRVQLLATQMMDRWQREHKY